MMKHPFADFDSKATKPFKESLVWTQDKTPHMNGTFDGVVLQGAAETQTAGIQTGYLLADIYTIHVALSQLIVDKFEVGDTISRGCWKTTILNVQRVLEDETGYWILCTAEERAPLG